MREWTIKVCSRCECLVKDCECVAGWLGEEEPPVEAVRVVEVTQRRRLEKSA